MALEFLIYGLYEQESKIPTEDKGEESDVFLWTVLLRRHLRSGKEDLEVEQPEHPLPDGRSFGDGGS